MRVGLDGEYRVVPRVFAVLLMLLVIVFALSQRPARGEASADPGELAAAPLDRLDPYDPYDPSVPSIPAVERDLALRVPGELVVGTSAAVLVEGVGDQGDEVTAFVDPNGEGCPASASARPAGAIQLLSEAAVEGAFRVEEDYLPRRPGDSSFCAYLEGASNRPAIKKSEARSVIARRLRASAAERTVSRALERHDFARRVVKSVKRDCRRQSRSTFGCKFSGRFPGYRLKGKGRVKLGIELTYRFRVKAQGIRLTLTDDNEESRSK